MYDLVITYSLHINLKIKKRITFISLNCLALLPSVEIILYPSVPIYK